MDVFWFGIDVMSANLSSPGEFENDMQDIYTRAKGCIARDRNVAVPWAAMGHQLLNIAVTSRSVWRYKVLRYSHSYYVTHDLQVCVCVCMCSWGGGAWRRPGVCVCVCLRAIASA